MEGHQTYKATWRWGHWDPSRNDQLWRGTCSPGSTAPWAPTILVPSSLHPSSCLQVCSYCINDELVFNITFTDYCIAFYPDVVDISLWKKKLLCLSNTDNNKICLPYGQGILVIWFCPCISSLPREILFYDRFDFSGTLPLKFDNQSSKTFEALHAGQTDGIFMWWDLEMDTKNKINLSCAPGWGHPRPEELQWRDHWMQAIYYPNQPLSVQKGDKVKVISSHDEYSLWFNVQQTNRYWTFICPLQFRLTCYIVIYSIISNV